MEETINYSQKGEACVCVWTGTEMAQLICGGCHTLLMYIRGATSVQCSCCHTVNLALEGTIELSFMALSVFNNTCFELINIVSHFDSKPGGPCQLW